MRVRFGPADVVGRGFERYPRVRVLPLQVGFGRAERRARRREPVVRHLQRRARESRRRIHEVAFRRHGRVCVLDILLANFRSQWRFRPRSFFWGVRALVVSLLSDDYRNREIVLLLDSHRAAADLPIVDAILELSYFTLYTHIEIASQSFIFMI